MYGLIFSSLSKVTCMKLPTTPHDKGNYGLSVEKLTEKTTYFFW